MEEEGVIPKGRQKLRYTKLDIKKNGLVDVNILDRTDRKLQFPERSTN